MVNNKTMFELLQLDNEKKLKFKYQEKNYKCSEGSEKQRRDFRERLQLPLSHWFSPWYII